MQKIILFLQQNRVFKKIVTSVECVHIFEIAQLNIHINTEIFLLHTYIQFAVQYLT